MGLRRIIAGTERPARLHHFPASRKELSSLWRKDIARYALRGCIFFAGDAQNKISEGGLAFGIMKAAGVQNLWPQFGHGQVIRRIETRKRIWMTIGAPPRRAQ